MPTGTTSCERVNTGQQPLHANDFEAFMVMTTLYTRESLGHLELGREV